jgi:type II secretory pathway pseudopilin PulG
MAMQRVSSGYTIEGFDKNSKGFTIVETIIVLAVSSLFIGMSLYFLSGSTESNRFSQSMRDIQSKVQDWINDVPTGFATGENKNGLTEVQCTKIGGTDGEPKIDTVVGTRASGDCIFLGKAIQFTDSSSPPTPNQDRQVYVYSVFGIRNTKDGLGGERQTGNLVEAHPAAADSKENNGTADLTEMYKLTGNSKVLSVCTGTPCAGNANSSHLAGFYTSFNQQSVTGSGAQDVRAYQYPLNGNQYPANYRGFPSTPADKCLDLSSVSCAKGPATPDDQWPPAMGEWKICFGNDSNNKTAMLTISSSNGFGAKTKLEFVACS